LLEGRLLFSSFESFTKDKTNSGGKVVDKDFVSSLYSFLENEWSRIIETLRLSNIILAFTSCAETEKAFSNASVHWGLGSPRPTKHSS